MNKYVSEYFTEELIKSLSNEWIYLLGAECGSGKTTAIMKKLVPFAERENKRVLYLCNRKALIEQLKSKYKYKEQGDAVVEINKNLTIAMYQKITAILTYGAEVSDVIRGEYDYVILDEAHLLYDASDYDYKTYSFIDYLKKVKSIIIALSGTPESVMKLKPYFSREIKVLREVDNTNNHIRKIILTDEIHRFKLLRKKYLNDGYKLIELVSNSDSFIDFQKELANYKVATLMSKSNPKKSLYMKEYDELVLETIIKKEELLCDAIAATKFLDVGVNIIAHQNFVVTYNSNEQTNTIEQFRSRIRFEKDAAHHLDLVFKVMTKQSSLIKIKRIKEYLKRYEEIYQLYGDFKTVLEQNPMKIFKIGFSNNPEDYEQYNAITKQLKEDQLAYYQRLYESDDILEEYKIILQTMYPQAEIVYLKQDNIKHYLEQLLGTEKVVLLEPTKIIGFRERMKQFKIDKVHSNELPSIKRINNYFKVNRIDFSIKSVRKTLVNGRYRCWEIQRHVS